MSCVGDRCRTVDRPSVAIRRNNALIWIYCSQQELRHSRIASMSKPRAVELIYAWCLLFISKDLQPIRHLDYRLVLPVFKAASHPRAVSLLSRFRKSSRPAVMAQNPRLTPGYPNKTQVIEYVHEAFIEANQTCTAPWVLS